MSCEEDMSYPVIRTNGGYTERAMLVKTAQGDRAVLVAHWAHMRKPVPSKLQQQAITLTEYLKIVLSDCGGDFYPYIKNWSMNCELLPVTNLLVTCHTEFV